MGLHWSNPLRSEGAQDDQAGRLVFVIGGQESQNTLKGPSGLNPLRSDGFRDGQTGGWSLWTEAELEGYILMVEAKDTQIVSDGKSLSQPACPREWKKCEEENR